MEGSAHECFVGYMQTWRRICEASRNEFDAIYQRLGVHILWRGESFYNPVLKSLVEELIERGIAEDSDGAQVTSHPCKFSPSLLPP